MGSVAVLPDASARRVVDGGHGDSERRRRARSGVLRGEEQRRGERAASEGGGERGLRASPWREGGKGELASAKQEVAHGRACAVSLLCLLAEVRDDWHQASGLGCPLGRPGKPR